MKRILTALMLLLTAQLAAQNREVKLDLHSPRVHYYLDLANALASRGELNVAQSAWKGADVWVLLRLDDGNIIFQKRPGGRVFYGVSPDRKSTMRYTRAQAIAELNWWLTLCYGLSEQDRQYEHLGFSQPCFMRAGDTPLETCPGEETRATIGVEPDYVGTKYQHSGEHTDGVRMTLWTTHDLTFAVLYRTDDLPCVEQGTGRVNFVTLVAFDIDEYLPQPEPSVGILPEDIPLGASLQGAFEVLDRHGFVELADAAVDQVWDEYNAALGGALGAADIQVTMSGRLDGAPCEITLHTATPGGTVHTVSGCFTDCYPTREALRGELLRRCEAIADRCGAGSWERLADGSEAFVIRNDRGSIALWAEQIGPVLEHEGEYRIVFVLRP